MKSDQYEVFMQFKKYAFMFISFFCFALFSLSAPQKEINLSSSYSEVTKITEGIGEFWSEATRIGLKAADYKPTLAILCFYNDTGDENLEYLRCGLLEWIIADLNQSKYINVLDGNRIQARITHIVTGSYSIANDNFIILVTLRNSRTGEITKTIKAECAALEEIPLIVDKLTTEIKAALNLSLDQISDDLDRETGQITTLSPEAFRHFLDGRKFHLRGREKEAVSSYRKALVIDPEFALAHWKMGMAFRQESLVSYAKRANALLKAMELSERLSERAILWIQGDYYSMTRYRYAQALKVYEKLLTLYPDDDKGRFDLGLLYFDLEEWEKAASQFRSVVEVDKENPVAHLNLARAYMNPGLYEKAQKVLESCLNSFGDNVNIYLSLALVHRFRGEYDLAHKVVDKAISLYPGDASCYANKGDIYLYSGDLDMAEEEYQKLFKHAKTEFHDLGLYRLAEMYLLKGRFKESRALAMLGFEQAQKLGDKGSMRDRLSFSATMDSLTGHPQEAIKKLDALWKTTLEDEELEWQRFVVYRKGLVYAETGTLDETLDEARRLKELIVHGLDKKKMRLYLHLMGVIELKRKNYQKAIEHLEKSLPMTCIRSRLNIAVTDSLASAYSGIGDLERARKEYERIATFPRGRQFYGDVYAKSFYRLGEICQDEGLKDKAVENYERFLEIWQDADPDVPEILAARQSLKTLKGTHSPPTRSHQDKGPLRDPTNIF